MLLSRLFLLFVLSVACGLAAGRMVHAAAPVQASFDCAKAATKTEKLICASPEVAAQDRDMVALFAAANGKAAVGTDASGALVAQRAWLKDRNTCANMTPDADATTCLASSYRERSAALAVQVLFSAPYLALDTLQKIDPQARNLYAALMIYVGGAKAPGQKAKLLELMNGFGPLDGQMMSDTNVSQPPYDVYLKNDVNFSDFFNMVAMGKFTADDAIVIEWSCDAIARRPGLSRGLGAYFGSTMDNFMPRSNCDERQPLPAAVESLIKLVNQKMPPCDGTIRFATYRGMAKDVSDMRLNIFVADPATKLDARKVMGKSFPAYQAALAALAGYYQQTFKQDLAKANMQAKGALDNYAGYLEQDACG
jgi:uncharacterized protein